MTYPDPEPIQARDPVRSSLLLRPYAFWRICWLLAHGEVSILGSSGLADTVTYRGTSMNRKVWQVFLHRYLLLADTVTYRGTSMNRKVWQVFLHRYLLLMRKVPQLATDETTTRRTMSHLADDATDVLLMSHLAGSRK